MVKKLLIVVFSLVLCAPVIADYNPPKLLINGLPENGELLPNDDLVELYIEPLDKTILNKDWVGVDYEWEVLNGYQLRKFTKYEDEGNVGIRIMPPRDGKNLLVLVTATHAYLSKDGDKTVLSLRKSKARLILKFVQNPNVDPCPPVPVPVPPGPGPVDPPTPVPPTPVPPTPPTPEPVPDGALGLIKVAYNAALTVPEGARKPGAMILAKNFADYAKKIRDEKLFDVPQILANLKALNEKSFDDAKLDRGMWTAFSSTLNEALKKLYNNGTLNVATDFASAFSEISDGLSRIK